MIGPTFTVQQRGDGRWYVYESGVALTLSSFTSRERAIALARELARGEDDAQLEVIRRDGDRKVVLLSEHAVAT